MARLQGLLDAVSLLDTTRAATPPSAGDPARPAGWCAKHGVQVPYNTKEGRSWYSHTVDGRWCKGK